MIYKTRHFNRWALKADLPDYILCKAVAEIRKGLIDADLGGGVIKKRIALPGHGKRGSTRTLLATNRNDRWVFVYGFEKSDRANISDNELQAIKQLADDLLSLTVTQISESVKNGSLLEVLYET